MYCIYFLINTINGKIYVGKTKNLHDRFRDHLKIARGGKTKYPNSYYYLHAALNKYGYDNFLLTSIVDDIVEENIAFALEQEWILKLKNDGYCLYNLTDGGDGTSGHKMSKEARRKISEAHLGKDPWNKGKSTPEDIKEKISKSLTNKYEPGKHPNQNKNSPLKGRKRSQDFCNKISQSKRGIPKSKEHRLATAKLTEEQVNIIRYLITRGVSNKKIAVIFGVHRDTISRIKNNKSWID